jgi:uncharacterized protein YqjF (DUF2071 family)
VHGIPVPFHTTFEEVNLRFYVRYKEGGEWKRGVVFLKEIVPRRAISFVANTLYNENYRTHAMKHRVDQTGTDLHVIIGKWVGMELPESNCRKTSAPLQRFGRRIYYRALLGLYVCR